MLFKRIKDWATTITAFRTGDVIAVDGPASTAKMSKDTLLQLTSQNALAGNVAPAFDPDRTSENPYKAGEIVVYDGNTYTFKVDHYGAWDASDVYSGVLADNIELLSKQSGIIIEDIDALVHSMPEELKEAVYREVLNVRWEQGTINASTGVDESSNYRIRTDYIDISKKLYLKNEDGNVSVIMRGYAADKSFIDNFSFVHGEIGQYGVWSARSFYLDFSSFPSVKYVRIIQKYVTDETAIEPSDNGVEIDRFFETLNDVTFDDILEDADKKPYSSNDISFVYDVPGGYYTKGFLKLPPNYVQAGKKVPLIVFVHGSGDISSINATSMTSGYNTYYNYLRDCGYAIFDCYPYSSKYSSQAVSSSNTWGLPINRSCYKAGIEYVLKNYNVDRSRIFVSCKSLGGLQAMSMFYDETIPITAVGMLAPEINPFSVYMGYSSASKKIAAADLDFSEDTGDVLDFDNGDPIPEGFWDYITANMQKWVGKFAIWCGLDIAPADKPNYYQRIYNTGSMFRKSLNRPVKIWIASDDNAVSYSNSVAFISSLNNGGYIGELRTMPDGTGGHHAVDSDPSALQTTNVTTPLGVVYETIPTAYYELELWFRKWL